MPVLVSDSHCHVKLVEFDDSQREEQQQEKNYTLLKIHSEKEINNNDDNNNNNDNTMKINMSNMVICGTHPCLDWELVESLYNKSLCVRTNTYTKTLAQNENLQMEEGHQEEYEHDVGVLLEREVEDSNITHVIIGFGVHPWYVPEINTINKIEVKSKNNEELVTNIVGNSDRTWANADDKLCTVHALTSLRLETLLAQLEEKLAQHPHAIVGEIGLDKLKGPSQQAQQEAFIAQLELASRYNRPVSIHCVRQYGLLLSLLSAFTSKKAKKEETSTSSSEERIPENHLPPSIIIHAFTGSAEIAESLLRLTSPHTNCRVYFGIGANTSLRVKNFISHTLPLLLERHRQEPCILLESDAFYQLDKVKHKGNTHDDSISTSTLHLSIADKDALSWQRLIHSIMPLFKGDLTSIEHTFARAFQSVLLR